MDPSLLPPKKNTSGKGLSLTRAQLNRPLTTLTNTKAQKTVPGVFNVTSAMKSGHVETGTIVRDKKSNRSLLKVFSLVFQEWKDNLTKKIESVSAPQSSPVPTSSIVISKEPIKPVDLEIPRQEEPVLQKTTVDSASTPRIPRIRTYAFDRAQILNTTQPTKQTTSTQPAPLEKKFHVDRVTTPPQKPINNPEPRPVDTPPETTPSVPPAPPTPVPQPVQSMPSRRRITNPNGIEKISFPNIGLTTQPHHAPSPALDTPQETSTPTPQATSSVVSDQYVSQEESGTTSPTQNDETAGVWEDTNDQPEPFHREGDTSPTMEIPQVVESAWQSENAQPIPTVSVETTPQRPAIPPFVTQRTPTRIQRQPPAVSDTMQSYKKMRVTIIVLGGILLLFCVGYFVYISRESETTEKPPQSNSTPGIVSKLPSAPTGTMRAPGSEPLIVDAPFITLTQTFHAQRTAQTEPLYTPYLVSPSDAGYTILTTQDFFDLFTHPLTPATLRAFDDEFTWGSVTSENESFPFIQFTINDFDAVFASLLAHEIDFAESVSPLISPLPFGTRDARFTDAIRANTSIRVLSNADGSERMAYGFIGKRTLIITISKQAFSVIVEQYRDNI